MREEEAGGVCVVSGEAVFANGEKSKPRIIARPTFVKA
jgi:hypothetical protein